MHCRRLKNTIEHFKSIGPFRSRCSGSGFNATKHLLNLTKNENVMVKSAIVRNVFSSSSPRKLASKNPVASKKVPTLCLKYNAGTNKFTLQTNLNRQNNEKIGSAMSSQESSTFCNICNEDPCKLVKKTENENNLTAKNNSSTVVILVDKDELCRIICSTSQENVRSASATQDDSIGSEYCNICKADRCKLTESLLDDSEKVQEKKKSSNENVISANEESSNEKGEYCYLCDAPKCKRRNLSRDSLEVQERDKPSEGFNEHRKARDYSNSIPENTQNENCMCTPNPILNEENKLSIEHSKKDSSNFIEIEVDKNELCRQICDDDEDLHPPESESKIVKADKIANPEYCSACRSPECKYDISSKSKSSLNK